VTFLAFLGELSSMDVLCNGFWPVNGIPFINRIDQAALRNPNIGVRQNELPQTRVQGIPIDLAGTAQNQLGRRAITTIATRDLSITFLHSRGIILLIPFPFPNTKYTPNRDITVNIAGPIKRVKGQNIFPVRVHIMDFFFFLRN
jgi:hypothetical protein